MFVRVIGGDFASLGIGKQIDRQGTHCLVEFFDAPTSDPIIHGIEASHLESYTLPESKLGSITSILSLTSGKLGDCSTITALHST